MRSRWATHVHLRNRVLGRHKIQDFWRPELHQVTARPFDNVYMTQPLAGGPERAVNRKDIMPATAPFVVDAAGQHGLHPGPRPDVTDSESDSDGELCVYTADSSSCCCCGASSATCRPATRSVATSGREHYSTVTRPQSYPAQYRKCFEISSFVDMTCV